MGDLVVKTKVMAIVCPRCGDTIYSRARHDCRFCSCGCNGVGVDGGPRLERVLWGKGISPPESFELEVDATEAELYRDWDCGRNKYGVIRKLEAGVEIRSASTASAFIRAGERLMQNEDDRNGES